MSPHAFVQATDQSQRNWALVGGSSCSIGSALQHRTLDDSCNVCRVLRRDLSIKRGLKAKKQAGEYSKAARGSEEGGAKCIATVHTELLGDDYDDIMRRMTDYDI